MKHVFLTLLAVAIVAVPAGAGDFATAEVNGLTIVFETTGSAHSYLLRVSAPGGDVFSQAFAGTETPSFTAIDDFGGVMGDGSYTWELTALPAPRARDTAGTMLEQRVQSGALSLRGGNFLVPREEPLTRDQVILDDLIVDGSACVGFDCVNGESFGFDTIRLKENNLRIKFMDTSGSPFPSNDWQITANDSASGGLNKFSIDDIDGGRTPFTIEARAPSHSLYVDDGGRLGLGTSIPVVDLHVVSGNSPTLRLEQNGSSGFAPQTWDVVGNETNFFVRDASNGSTLPFRIRPGSSTNRIYIDDDNVGIGHASPDTLLHMAGADAPALRIENTSATAGTSEWEFKVNGVGSFAVDDVGDGAELIVTSDAQLRISAQASAPGSCTAGAMYIDNSPSITLCLCTSTNSWTGIGGGGNCS